MGNEVILTDKDFADYGFVISKNNFMCKDYILDYRDGHVKLQDYETELTEEDIELNLESFDENKNEPIDIRILSNLQAVHHSLTGKDLKKLYKKSHFN